MGFERIRVWRHLFGGGNSYSRVDQLETWQGQAELRNMIHAMHEHGLFEQKLMDLSYVAIDTESTGFSPRDDVLLAVAGVVYSEGTESQNAENFSSFIKLPPGVSIPPVVQELTGITPERLAGAPTLEDVLQQLVVFLDDRVLIAHHAGHDMAFLNAGLRKTWGVELTSPVIDTGEVALYLHHFKKYPALDVLLQLYDITSSDRHTALGDALMTARIWQKQLRLLVEAKIDTLGAFWETFMRERQKRLN
ncbi:3'-5' exonuclease [Sulfoacidibacillus thermotolerans]|uniref:Exonuclease domain-containing protein n=1 Tax=Sulfoacidibacillus thermotolerans TaxID=1765684 RepID=A0A2U3D799_SULT2|nr:exonuclease domain-containing protein [Sulfoacidibacillus thermotolerans]PWI57156.1 hypothetical protein BM613_09800 [Sulfoacidibacillus thermotolerans]